MRVQISQCQHGRASFCAPGLLRLLHEGEQRLPPADARGNLCQAVQRVCDVGRGQHRIQHAAALDDRDGKLGGRLRRSQNLSSVTSTEVCITIVSKWKAQSKREEICTTRSYNQRHVPGIANWPGPCPGRSLGPGGRAVPPVRAPLPRRAGTAPPPGAA